MSEGMNATNGIDEINTQYALIDSLTKEDIQKAAQEVFSNKPIYSVRASHNTLAANKNFFEQLMA